MHPSPTFFLKIVVIPRILQAHPDINQQENDQVLFSSAFPSYGIYWSIYRTTFSENNNFFQVSTAETLNTLENKVSE